MRSLAVFIARPCVNIMLSVVMLNVVAKASSGSQQTTAAKGFIEWARVVGWVPVILSVAPLHSISNSSY